MTQVEMVGTQVFVNPDINRDEFERAFLDKFIGGEFKFYNLVPDAHNGQKMYELWVPKPLREVVLPWFEQYWSQRGFGTKQGLASGFGWSHSG